MDLRYYSDIEVYNFWIGLILDCKVLSETDSRNKTNLFYIAGRGVKLLELNNLKVLRDLLE